MGYTCSECFATYVDVFHPEHEVRCSRRYKKIKGVKVKDYFYGVHFYYKESTKYYVLFCFLEALERDAWVKQSQYPIERKAIEYNNIKDYNITPDFED